MVAILAYKRILFAWIVMGDVRWLTVKYSVRALSQMYYYLLFLQGISIVLDFLSFFFKGYAINFSNKIFSPSPSALFHFPLDYSLENAYSSTEIFISEGNVEWPSTGQLAKYCVGATLKPATRNKAGKKTEVRVSPP